MKDATSIPCCLYRGGTSKGVLFHAHDVPEDQEQLTQVLLRVMGSPDPRQIDGLGGADPLTSRVGIIRKSTLSDTDIEFHFAFVHIEDPIVDFEGFCGNLISAAALFAIEEGLVEKQNGITPVKIYDHNTKMQVLAEVESGNRVVLHFLNPGNTLLPTGNVCDVLEGVEVSMVHCIDPTIFINAKDLGLTGKEKPEELDKSVLDRLEKLRLAGAEKMGLKASGSLPKIVYVSENPSPETLNARMLAVRKIHRAYAVSCGACTAAAALIPGSVVNQCIGGMQKRILINHPEGTMEVLIEGTSSSIEKITIERSARCLMKGHVFI